MIKINVLSEENSWSKKLKKKEIFFNNICKYFPKKFQFINKKVYLTLLLSNNLNIKKLNKIFRNKNNHTDILSFPFHQKKKANEKDKTIPISFYGISKLTAEEYIKFYPLPYTTKTRKNQARIRWHDGVTLAERSLV